MSQNKNMNPSLDPKDHKKCAVELFNSVWDLIEKEERTTEEDDMMVHAAHASRHHWGIVGTSVNLARGEWQVSRVYAILQRSEAAIYHAQRCLDICLENQIGDFDLAFAYEALARAHAVGGNIEQAQNYLKQAETFAEDIQNERDRELLYSDLKTIFFHE